MEKTFSAIVLRRFDSGESDRRIVMLTAEAGKVTAVARGARKAASRLAAFTEPLATMRVTLAEGKRTRFVTQAEPTSGYRRLRSDFDRLTYALALAELYALVVPQDEPQPDLYELLALSLRAIEEHPRPLAALLWAEARLMRETGFRPVLDRCVDTGEPISGGRVSLSPAAGGVVSAGASARYPDRYEAAVEAVVALDRLADLDAPPGNVRRAEECALALHPFWRNLAEGALPASETVINEIRLRPRPDGG